MVSTVTYLVLFAFLLTALGAFVGNVLALAISVLTNTVAHAIFTLRPATGVRWRNAVVGGATIFVVNGLLTSTALWVSRAAQATSTIDLVTAVFLGSIVASLVRFILVRAWSFRLHLRASAT